MDPEYYSSLYKWFEKCGVISNIRTHLRQNLINALKNYGPKSAKQYIYDLLIAEYLLNHNYEYTLSVFASEAPLLVNFSNKTVEISGDNEKDNKKLQNDYILHVLETLGINPRDPEGQYVISQYTKNDMPLLLCILKSITMFSYNIHNDVPIKEKISLCNESTQTEVSWQLNNFYTKKLTVLKSKISAHKQMMDNKLRRKEMILKEQAVVIKDQLLILNTKLHQVQNMIHNMNLREKQLKEKIQNNKQVLQKEKELTLKEKLLLQKADRLQREQEDLKKLEEEFKKVRMQRGVQTEHTVKLSNHFLQSIEIQTDIVKDVQQDKIEVLIKEKEKLNALIQEQQLRIEQITQRALQLSRQVEGIRSLRPTEVPTQTINANTVISESSSTEDILQDAKMRLKRLEEESLKADHNI
ncbi:hypothetical protein E2986_07658 [Frieseomelitta varia]|uniref:LisH domain-containing protein n=1 Tax=Frieseomelitta varia TaxID=561572 RepID=A0A833VMX3_9HYME|nr:hypothetical protein E2986_07658 [Frieseomelitta varia]